MNNAMTMIEDMLEDEMWGGTPPRPVGEQSAVAFDREQKQVCIAIDGVGSVYFNLKDFKQMVEHLRDMGAEVGTLVPVTTRMYKMQECVPFIGTRCLLKMKKGMKGSPYFVAKWVTPGMWTNVATTDVEMWIPTEEL